MTDPNDMPTSVLLEVYIGIVIYLGRMGNPADGDGRRRARAMRDSCAVEIDRRIPKEKSDGE